MDLTHAGVYDAVYTGTSMGPSSAFLILESRCIWLLYFESLGQAMVVINRWAKYYND